MAASDGRRVYVVGGYAGAMDAGSAVREAWVLEGGRWQALPRPPERRAAGGAAVALGKLYVVGGVGPNGLARKTLVFDLVKRRWSTAPGPTPREHLAVTALRGRVYALGGRRAGTRHEPRGARVVHARGQQLGRAAARARAAWWHRRCRRPAAGSSPSAVRSLPGRSRAVYAYTSRRGAGRGSPICRRRGTGSASSTLGGRVYAVGGGPQPGLFVSDAVESLAP